MILQLFLYGIFTLNKAHLMNAELIEYKLLKHFVHLYL